MSLYRVVRTTLKPDGEVISKEFSWIGHGASALSHRYRLPRNAGEHDPLGDFRLAGGNIYTAIIEAFDEKLCKWFMTADPRFIVHADEEDYEKVADCRHLHSNTPRCK